MIDTTDVGQGVIDKVPPCRQANSYVTSSEQTDLP